MSPREALRKEARFEPMVRALVRSINHRLSSAPVAGDTWVRVRPPTLRELDSDERHPALVKFYRVGTVIQVSEVLKDFVEVVCGREALMIAVGDFLDTWVKTDRWSG